MAGTLYIVATPIGNLEDISLRAKRILSEVDFIAAEDTRHTGLLLQKLALPKKPLISYQEHNELQRIPEVIQLLTNQKQVALVTDAGTPALSDPGYKLIRTAIEQSIPIDVIPGPSAVLTALAGSGLPTDKFYFGGFLPRTSSKRQKILTEVSSLPATLIFFESPHRISQALRDAHASLGSRPAVVARELTKVHQQFHRGTLGILHQEFEADRPKGEMVLLIAGSKA